MIIEAVVVRHYPEGDYDYQWTCTFCGQVNENTDFNMAPHEHAVICTHCLLPGQSVEFPR